jgi:hypothetical protein
MVDGGAMAISHFATLLRAAGVSRPWLARQTGRSRGAVDRWCNGTAQPPAAVVAWLQRRISDPPPTLGGEHPEGTRDDMRAVGPTEGAEAG